MKYIYIVILLVLPWGLYAQEDTTGAFSEEAEEETMKNWSLTGYVKDFRTVLLNPNFDNIILDNLIHNRLNFEWYPNEKWTFKAEMRNRVFYGNLVQFDTAYADRISNANNDVLDMSAVLVDKNAMVVHSMFDRLSVNYSSGAWNVRLGRQRINWGINLLWNPNDIFNSYSFTDFDYEERPGSDALLVQYYTGAASSIEVAVKAFTKKEEIVAAGLWKLNKGNYDFQLLGGVAYEDIVLGGGWAGNIKNAGFKGEFSTFVPYADNGDSISFTGTLGIDYSFPNSTFVAAGLLFNTNGTTGQLDLTQSGLTLGNNSGASLTAKNLYPYQYALFSQVSYPFTPIFSGAVSVVYSPSEDQAVFINPSFTASVTQNLDFDITAQLFALNYLGEYKLLSKALFLRLKRSF
jgi:hypothetical protein